ncbi:MAG: hypothetical protein HXX17_07840 [Geobacteraceae bacterium]|nr:hypothetical protein [Geobacteraceae bacterium]
MNRQKAILAALAALLVCSIIYSFMRMPKQERVDKLTFRPGMTVQPTRKGQAVSDEVRVRLDLLEKNPGTAPGGGRNIFQPLFESGSALKKVSIPLPPPPPPPEKKPPPPAPVQLPTAPAVVEQTPLQRDMATFTFLGFLKKDSRKTIFLSNGREIFLVKKGDKISGKYDVTLVTDEAITISSINDGGEIVIPLVENRPLAAPRK